MGVLFKYLNLTSGWRPRLFVLQEGVFRYYKIYGPTAVNVHVLLEALRQEGEIYPIGAEVTLLETRDKRKLQQAASYDAVAAAALQPGAQRVPPAHSEVHLQVASIQESGTDNRVFKVNSGTATIRLRSECK